MGKLTVTIASVSDRDELVGELWSEDVQFAEVRTVDGAQRITVFAPPSTTLWDFSLSEFVEAVGRAARGVSQESNRR